MRYWVKVICNNVRDTETCLALMNDGVIVLIINVCDGWQRQASVGKIKMATCRNVLFSSLFSNSLSGYPGFYLTANDAAMDKGDFFTNIYGPKGLGEYCQFLEFQDTPKHWATTEICETCSPGKEDKKSETMILGKEEKVEGILVPGKEEKKELSIKQIDHPFDVDGKYQVFPLFFKSINPSQPMIISYILSPYSIKGKFKGDEAKKMGLSVDQIKILVAGTTLTLADGKTIDPKTMYNEPTQPASVLILYIPSLEYLESVIKNKQIESFLANPKQEIGLVYHSAPYEVLIHPSYIEFAEKFGKKTGHVFDSKELNDDTCPRYVALQVLQALSEINSRIFPNLPKTPIHKADKEKRAALSQEFTKRGLKHFYSVAGFDYGFYPGPEVSKQSTIPGFHQEALVKADSKIIEEMKKKIVDNPKLTSIYNLCNTVMPTKSFKNEPFIVILGTASQKPLKYRCVSSIYMNVPGMFEGKAKIGDPDYFAYSYGILLDAGEGAYGQLVDHFCNPSVIANILLNLRIVHLSHYHGDHIFGITKMLTECDAALIHKYGRKEEARAIVVKENPLYLLLPNNLLVCIKKMIDANSLFYVDRIRLINLENLNPDPESHFGEGALKKPVTPSILLPEETIKKYIDTLYKMACSNIQDFWADARKVLNIHRIHSFDTDHCKGSHGIVIEGGDWKLVYSSDTVPCASLVNFSKGADLLIHECTFADNLPRKDEDVRHTTLAHTLSIFDNVLPWRMLLTHFSNKSSKITTTSEDHLKRKIFVSFDHLQFKLSDADWMYQLTPLLEELIIND